MKDQNLKNELSVADNQFPINIEVDELRAEDYQLDEEEFDARLIQFLLGLLKGISPDSPWIAYLDKQTDFSNLEGLASVPMLCKADDCPYASVCPLMRSLKRDPEARKALVGTECRVEKARIVKLFVQLVSDLKITPVQATDVLALTNLVRLYVLENRLIWDLGLYGMIESVPGVVAQRTGEVFYKREPNPAEKMLERIRKQIDSLNAQLLASRKDRAALANSMSKNPSLSKILLGTGVMRKYQGNTPSIETKDELELGEIGELDDVGGPLIE